MVKIREKSSITIRPTRIDKQLLVNLGRILKEECPEEHEIGIELQADSRDIKTEDYEEFKNLEIPSDIYVIKMRTKFGSLSLAVDEILENKIVKGMQIEIDLRRPKNSKIRITGDNATWVRGVGGRLFEAFEKKKLGYRYVAEHGNVRAILSLMSSILLAYTIGSILWLFKIEFSYVAIFSVVFFVVMQDLLKRFFDWVFPYFEIESEDFLPPKVRKWALAILWGSGILPAILFKILGL